MQESRIILNKATLPQARLVSSVNHAFVVALSLGREYSKTSGYKLALSGAFSPPIPITVSIGTDDALKNLALYSEPNGKTKVHPYPTLGLTKSYEAYAAAVKATPSDELKYLTVAALEGGDNALILVNSQYVAADVLPLVQHAAILGFGMGTIHPDGAFGHDVEDADGKIHGYLTCIRHLVQEKEDSKDSRRLSDFFHSCTQVDDSIVLYPSETGMSSSTIPDIFAVWASVEAGKKMGIRNWESSKMHPELDAMRDATERVYKKSEESQN